VNYLTTPTGGANPIPVGSEYDVRTWRHALGTDPRLAFDANLSALPRVGDLMEAALPVDLSPGLWPYPAPSLNNNTHPDTTLADYRRAASDRQQLASRLFLVLRRATAAQEPEIVLAAAGANWGTDRQFQALRYLAQIAVNIVDFVDADDYITPFQWV